MYRLNQKECYRIFYRQQSDLGQFLLIYVNISCLSIA